MDETHIGELLHVQAFRPAVLARYSNVSAPAEHRQPRDLILVAAKVAHGGVSIDGAPQDIVMYRYLQRLRIEGADDSQVEQAFCSVLSDYIGSAPEGAWDVDAIEKKARESGPVAQAVGS